MMPPIKGRLGDRKNATMELADRKIHVVTGGGFLGGKPENMIISLDDVGSIKHETGVKPFPEAMMIEIDFLEGELSFFSVNTEPLERLAKEAEEYVERRARLLQEMEKEYASDREAHVALLFLDLEFADALLELIVLLQGSVDWEKVEAQYKHVKRVNQDRENLTKMKPASLSLDKLGQGIEDRVIDVIKAEAYDILFILHESCIEKGKHSETWFDTALHGLFMEVLIALWSRRLESITEESTGGSLEKINRRFHELERLISQETGDEEAKTIDPASDFIEARNTLYGMVEGLGDVGFDPGDELERRLAAAAPVDHVSP